MAREDTSGMRPKLGDSVVTLPITFDYSGGRGERSKSVKLWSVILCVVGLIIAFGLLFSDRNILLRIVLFLGVIYIVSAFVRFVLLREVDKKEEYKKYIHDDYVMDYGDIWGIYRVNDVHPYICRFRNGKSGVYIRLNKDVILGKYLDSEYNHFEAVADAYNIAGAGKVQMVHIDYMDNVGSDERLEESFISLGEVSNPDLKDLLTDIYGFQQSNIMRRVTTFDVYAFIWTGNDITAWNTITRILNCFLDANYRSYKVLDESDIRDLVKTVFNLNDFSVVDASTRVFSGEEDTTSIVPISVVDGDGNVTVINKTRKEKEEERKQREAARKAKEEELARIKQEKKKGKRVTKK